MTDGTSAGTTALAVAGADSNGLFIDLNADNTFEPVYPDFTVFGKKALFEGRDAGDHLNLWITDGTSAGTKTIAAANAYSGGLFYQAGSQFNADLTILAEKVLFQGVDKKAYVNLWVTDGTSAGTEEVKVAGASPFGLFNPATPQFAVFRGKVLFVGLDNRGSVGLWVTDGTSAGTSELKVAGAYSGGLFSDALPVRRSSPDFTVLGNKVIFEGLDAGGNANLWATDGTAAGTHELKVRGASSSGLEPDDITALAP